MRSTRSPSMNGRSARKASLMSIVSASASEISATRMGGTPSGNSGKNRATREFRGGSELFFNAQKLVVFCDAVGAGGGAGLDLARARGDGEVSDEGVFGFAAAMRNDGVVAGF